MNLHGHTILLPSFYCEDTVEFCRRFAEVAFYRMDWTKLETDKDSFIDALKQHQPKFVVIYNVFGKDSFLHEDVSWLPYLPKDSVIISDCAHSLMPLHFLHPLTSRHFFIDSARKCTPFMFSQCVCPNNEYKSTGNISYINMYTIRARLLFQFKQILASLHFATGLGFLANWSEAVFMIHNSIIGLENNSHAAYRYDIIGYAHIDFNKVADSRYRLWTAYISEFSKDQSPLFDFFKLTTSQIKQMCYFPLRVNRKYIPDLIEYCLTMDVMVDRLWDLEKTVGLPKEELKQGMEIIVLPLTPSMETKDAMRVASTLINYCRTVAENHQIHENVSVEAEKL
jgi:hypothetical protein